MSKALLNPWTALLTLVIVLFIRHSDPMFVESVRLRYFDTLITSKAPTENNIVTVNIDEAALDKYGQWPLPRGEYANIIKDLYNRGAGLVVFNIIMAERDRSGGDILLANALKTYPVVLGSVPSSSTKNQPRTPGSAVIGADYLDQIVQYPGLIANIPILENAAAGIGIVNTLPEIDGVNRRIPLIVAIDGKLYPSMAMETLRVAAGDTTFQVKLNENGVEKMRIPKFGPIATDALGRIWIDWSQTNQSYSLIELPQDLKGAIVIVGPTAAGISNPLPTSKGAVWPHDVQAAVIGTMINGVVISRPDYADGAETLVIAVVGILLLFLTRYVYVGLVSVLIICLAVLGGSQYLFSNYLLLFDVTAILVGTILVALHAYGIKFVSEFLQKQQIKKQFGTYLSPALVEKLQKNPELLTLGGESRELSIMFTDVRGFTTISEHYGKDVQGLTKIMNRYMTAMTAKIIENNGTLDKYIGDAQMAFWNAPLDEPNHAKMAVKTALQMMESLNEFNAEITTEGIPAFGMGLGINTDVVVVGNMGSDQRFDYTCLGDGVNLSSRLEGQSKNYGVRIILGPKTAELVRDEYDVFELDCIAVKGKHEGVKVYTLSTQTNAQNAFLYWYYEGEWEEALLVARTEVTSNLAMKEYYAIMIARLEEGKSEAWNGTYKATSK